MTEDQVKEISAKICHEKMKGLYEKVYKDLEAEIKYQIYTGSLKIDHFVNEECQKRIENEVIMYMTAVLQKSFAKFMQNIRS